jgi:site-specific DNA recombinase
MTGGRIELFQQGERTARGGWLQGRFRSPLVTAVVSQALGVEATSDELGVDVVIDYVAPVAYEEDAERAYALHKAGVANRDIAVELHCSRSNVTKLLDYAYQQRGQQRVDGRKAQWQRERRDQDCPSYEQIAEEVKQRMDQGQLLHEIAKELGTNRDTVTRAKNHWFTSRDLPVPDGRSRRKTPNRVSPDLSDSPQ